MADDYVWEKVCRAINNPEILIAKARQMVHQLRGNSQALEDDQDRIQKELDALVLERQWVITQARRGGISQTDMDYPLGALTLQELTLKRDLMSVDNAIDANFLQNWDGRVREYFVDLQVGLESLNAAPRSDEERQEIFNLKRNIVLALVQKVTIDRNRELTVHFNLDILRILQDQTDKQDVETNRSGGITAVQTQFGGTYTRIPDMYRAGQLFVQL